ncbi:MAG: MFS transporter [Acidimicrobiales bacterium]
MDNTIVNVALPTLSRSLHASTGALQWIVASYSLTFAGPLIAAGSLSDRRGRKGTLSAGLAGFAAASLLALAGGAVARRRPPCLAARVGRRRRSAARWR